MAAMARAYAIRIGLVPHAIWKGVPIIAVSNMAEAFVIRIDNGELRLGE